MHPALPVTAGDTVGSDLGAHIAWILTGYPAGISNHCDVHLIFNAILMDYRKRLLESLFKQTSCNKAQKLYTHTGTPRL